MVCLACGSARVHRRAATVSPFIAMRVWKRPPHRGELCTCTICGLRFFEPLLTESDLSRLYRDYRGREYQTLREQFEPWYTVKFNASLEAPEVIARRRDAMRSVLNAHLGFRPQ